MAGDRADLNVSLTIPVLASLTKGLPFGGPDPFWPPGCGRQTIDFVPILPAGGGWDREPGGSVPRLRPHRAEAAFAVGALITAFALTGGALAQAVPPTLPEIGLFDPPSGQGVLPGAADEAVPLRPITAQVYGNPPASGAATAGFDSTNARKKIQAKTENKKKAQPLALPVTTQIRPAQPLPRSPVTQAAEPKPPDPVIASSVPRPYTVSPQPPPKPKLKTPETDPYAPLGIRVGSFILKPSVDAAAGFDSNVPRSATASSSSFYTIAPELQTKSDWERHEFRSTLRGSYSGYPDLPSFNRPSFESILDGRIDVTRQTRIELQDRFQFATETPGSPNFQTDSKKPTPYTTFGGTVGLFHQFNRLEIGAKVAIDRTRYEDSELNDGTIVNNNDRDYTSHSVELRGSYEWAPGVKPFVAVTADKRLYDLAEDRFGINRDSRGLTPRVGSTFELGRLVTGQFSVGYTKRDYDDPQLEGVSGIVADASLVWAATALTKATFTASSTVYESTQPNVSGVLTRDFGIKVDHALREWLIGTVKFGYGIDEYVGSPQVDNRFTLGAGLTYKMNRNVQWKGEVRREQRTSNVKGQDYTANIFLLGVRLQD
jgi:hypothetical protein